MMRRPPGSTRTATLFPHTTLVRPARRARKPVIFGLAGPALTDDERTFFREAAPAGYILFKRNIENRAQVRALTDSLRDLAGRDDLAILIDQEGGRVARMQPPEWPAFPAGPAFAKQIGRAHV